MLTRGTAARLTGSVFIMAAAKNMKEFCCYYDATKSTTTT